MKRIASGIVAVAVVLLVAGCSGGPSSEERAEFDKFALERQSEYPSGLPASAPTSIREYVIGGDGVAPADYIVMGAFTGATTSAAPPGTVDSSAYTLMGEFKLHQSVKGTVPSSFDVNLGTAAGAFLPAYAMRGAGDVVLFLRMDAASGQWVLVDGKYALAQSDGGDLSMPLVPAAEEARFLMGIVDVADIQALIIAGNLDPNGSLTGGLDDLGNDGISDTEQDLIDQANDLAD